MEIPRNFNLITTIHVLWAPVSECPRPLRGDLLISLHELGEATVVLVTPRPNIHALRDVMSDETALIESAKKLAALKAVDEYFDPSFRFVGIGSGTTIQYVVDAIRQKCQPDGHTLFIPTGWQSRAVIEGRGLIAVNFDSLPEHVQIDVAFDGADEVDAEMNCVKGGGACLFQEKLVATRAKKFVCIAGTFSSEVELMF